MSEWFGLRFLASDEKNAETFIREYCLDAIGRYPSRDSCENIQFAYGSNPDHGDTTILDAVALSGMGDVEAIVQEEREVWEAYVEDGVLMDWYYETKSAQETEQMSGELGSELLSQLGQLSSEMAVLAYEEFDQHESLPHPVDTYPDEKSMAGPVGWWAVLHLLTNQMGYTINEELDAFMYGIEHTLRNIVEYRSQEEATQRIDQCIVELEAMKEITKEGRHLKYKDGKIDIEESS